MSEDEAILTHILKVSRSQLLLKKPRLDPAQKKQYEAYKSRRKKGEPLQYILGSMEFYGLEFKVDVRVLVPRPETEILVDLAVKYFKGTDILDLGTGAGNITVTLAKTYPYVKVTTVDISVDALQVASENIQRHGVEGRVEMVHEDMGTFLASCLKTFDLIISNPPYVPQGQLGTLPKDVQREPSIALDGGADGLDFYRTIIKCSPRLLRAGGYLMMELGDGQADAVRALLTKPKTFSNIEIHRDLAGKERIIVCS